MGKPARQKYTAHNARPYVGYVCSGNTIRLRQSADEATLSASPASLWMLGLIILMVGSAVVFGIQSPEFAALRHFWRWSPMHQIGVGLVGGMMICLYWLALHFACTRLFANRRISIGRLGDIHFFAGLSKEPARTVQRDEIAELMIVPVSFSGRYRTHLNYLLVMQLRTGEEMVLCASNDKAQIEAIIHTIRET